MISRKIRERKTDTLYPVGRKRRTSNDCYVCEIESGIKLNEQRQLYEEMIMILEGRGSTIALADQALEAKMNKAMTPVGYFYLKIKMVEL